MNEGVAEAPIRDVAAYKRRLETLAMALQSL